MFFAHIFGSAVMVATRVWIFCYAMLQCFRIADLQITEIPSTMIAPTGAGAGGDGQMPRDIFFRSDGFCAILPGIPWNYPPPSNSHHQDYYIFSRESLQTFICHCYWVGVDPRYTYYFQ